MASLIGCVKYAPSIREALQAAGFLDADGKIHGWQKHNEYHENFAARAKTAAVKRWEEHNRKKQEKEDRKQETGNRKRKEETSTAQASNGDVASILEALSKNVAYEGIDLPIEMGKAQAWCVANRRKLSHRFFVNWLNKVEKPMKIEGNGHGHLPPAPRELWKIRPDIADKEKALVGVRQSLGQTLNGDGKWGPPLTGGAKVRVDALKEQISKLKLEMETAPV